MFNEKENIDFIIDVAMQGKPIEPIEVEFILEDFHEGGKIIINESHLFEILKVENGTVLIKPIGTSLLVRETTNLDKRTTTRRFVDGGKIVEQSL